MGSELELVDTDELISEIIRRNQRTVVIMDREGGEIIDGEMPFRIHSGQPEADDPDYNPDGVNHVDFRTIDLLMQAQKFLLTIAETKLLGN